MVLRRFLMAALAVAAAMLCVPDVEAQTPADWPADLRWLLDNFLMGQQGAWEEYETPRF